MALITYKVSSFHNDEVSGTIVYDDATMLAQQFIYHNATSQPASIEVWNSLGDTLLYSDILSANLDRTKNIPASQRPSIADVSVRMNWPA